MILAHVFDGRLFCYEARLDRFLDPSPKLRRVNLLGVLSGHSQAIETLIRTADGKSMVSSTHENELVVWSQAKGDRIALSKQSSISPSSRAHRAVVLDDGMFTMGPILFRWESSRVAL